MCTSDNVFEVWNLSTPTRLNAAARMEFQVLISDFSAVRFNRDMEDELQWALTKTHNRLPTRDFLRRRHMEVSSDFLFCNSNETSSRLFLHCPFARELWEEFVNKLRWFFCMPSDIIPSLQAGHLTLHDKDNTAVWNLVPMAIIWSIWKERNSRVFTDKRNNAKVVVNKVVIAFFDGF
ncbi:uncharacterized protein LOC113278962 [Papaver somniferum]|uniref:uncharacterized protein LOC113278962 n=1 Tax=Papaver somniferum TaxID=3469 RepID=UPI000E6F58E9|nr:uncharacterized protein LOC113278962 [Papaver somniferum]